MPYAERRVADGVDVWRGSGGPGPQRILPDGCLDLLWDGQELLVAGPDTTARVHYGSGTPTWGVRLHGGRGPELLGVPADELTDQTAPLAALWSDRDARALNLRVSDDPATALAAWAATEPTDPFGMRLRALVADGRPVAEAADALGYSPRQLQRRTRTTFGYGPQHLRRVLRLQRAVAAADAGATWSTVAAGLGYTDQAHLTRDVRDLTGLTPAALRRERVRSRQDAA